MKAAAAVSENRAAEPHSFASTLWKQGVHTIVKSGRGGVETCPALSLINSGKLTKSRLAEDTRVI